MAVLKVARMGHPVLRQVAEKVPVSEIKTDEFQRFVGDMLDTVAEYEGAGLAAPQVHVSKRVVVLELTEEIGMEVWINPVLTPTTEEATGMFEGCLSVPGLRGFVPRPAGVRVEALDQNGQAFVLELEGFAAVVAQHECDHLDGVLYVDKVVPQTLTFLEEHRRFGARFGAGDSDEEVVDDLNEDHTDAFEEGV